MQLPIDPHLPHIAAALKSHSRFVLMASPGSGKTTRVPPYLIDHLPPHKQIWVLEPRRLAAKLSALRVAEEMNVRVGEAVGYHFRFEKAFSSKTRLLFLTEGMLVRRMMSDPALAHVGLLILDEFHERSLFTDLALGLAKRLQEAGSPLKLLIMSATLDTGRLSEFLGGAPVLDVPTPRFPVEIEFSEGVSDRPLEGDVKQAVRKAMDRSERGDILVFLPGMREIRRCEETVQSLRQSLRFTLHVLHGDVPSAQQEAAVRPSAERKVILSTNIAETSLTIPGVEVVIDSGAKRAASHSWWSGMTRLETKPISKASAIQRAGRAGRTGPGVCLRLYSKHDFDHRPAFDVAEVLKSDLSQTCLELFQLGVEDPRTFSWYESPPESAISAALVLLERLGAIDRRHKITALGRQLVTLPVHPRLGRFLIEAQSLHVLESAFVLAAQIQNEEYPSIDLMESKHISRFSHAVERSRRQLEGYFPVSRGEKDDPAAVAQALLTGFPDRVGRARRSSGGTWELVLSEGGTAKIKHDHLSEGIYFLLVDVSETKNERSQVNRWAKGVAKIEPEWLLDLAFNPLIEKEEAVWDERQRVAKSVSILSYGQLTLERKEMATGSSEAMERVFVENALHLTMEKWRALSPNEFVEMAARYADREEVESALARVFLAGEGKAGWEGMRLSLQRNLLSEFSTKALEARDWIHDVLETLPAPQRHSIDSILPTHLMLKTGRKVKINYRLDRSPWIESRLQDFFGMKEVPQLLNSKVRPTLHLLAPNHEAVQITHDLEGFWSRDYPRVRKELGRQYPRHAWPENPLVVPVKQSKK